MADSDLLIFDTAGTSVPAVWFLSANLTQPFRMASLPERQKTRTDTDNLEFTALAWSPVFSLASTTSVMAVGTKSGKVLLAVVDHYMEINASAINVPEALTCVSALVFAPRWRNNRIAAVAACADGLVVVLDLELDTECKSINLRQSNIILPRNYIQPTSLVTQPLLALPIPSLDKTTHVFAIARGRDVSVFLVRLNTTIQAHAKSLWKSKSISPVTGITWGPNAGTINLFTQDGELERLDLIHHLNHNVLPSEAKEHRDLMLSHFVKEALPEPELESEADGKKKPTKKSKEPEFRERMMQRLPIVYSAVAIGMGAIHGVYFNTRFFGRLDYREPKLDVSYLAIKSFAQTADTIRSYLRHALSPDMVNLFTARAIMWDIIRAIRTYYIETETMPDWYESILTQLETREDVVMNSSTTIKEMFKVPHLVSLRYATFLLQNIVGDEEAFVKMLANNDRILFAQLDTLSTIAIRYLHSNKLDKQLLLAILMWIDLGIVLAPHHSPLLATMEGLLEILNTQNVKDMHVEDGHGTKEAQLLAMRRQGLSVNMADLPRRHRCPACSKFLIIVRGTDRLMVEDSIMLPSTDCVLKCDMQHRWSRCMVTLLPLDSPRTFSCKGCREKMAARGVYSSPLLEAMVEAVDDCLICAGSLEASNPFSTNHEIQ
jgi:hypothetical protein